jgi:hypothetical protein
MEERILKEEEVISCNDGYYNDLVEFVNLCNISPTYIETVVGTWRFKPNSIIEYLLEYHGEQTKKDSGNNGGLNLIWDKACNDEFTLKEMVELYIHMGYSLCGFYEVFGDDINRVLRIRHDLATGDFIDRRGPTEETKKYISQSAAESRRI